MNGYLLSSGRGNGYTDDLRLSDRIGHVRALLLVGNGAWDDLKLRTPPWLAWSMVGGDVV